MCWESNNPKIHRFRYVCCLCDVQCPYAVVVCHRHCQYTFLGYNFHNITRINTKIGLKYDSGKIFQLLKIKHTRQYTILEPVVPNIANTKAPKILIALTPILDCYPTVSKISSSNCKFEIYMVLSVQCNSVQPNISNGLLKY